MKKWLNSINLLACTVLGVIIVLCGGLAQGLASANTAVAPVRPPGAVRLIALPRLVAAGSKDYLWLTIPSKPVKPLTGPQFLLLSHALNARKDNAALWRQVSTGSFTGYPDCAAAAENPISGAMKHGVYLFFQNGYGVCFGRKESISLPPLNGTLFPVAAANESGNVYLLAYGTVGGTNNAVASPVQKILSHVHSLADRMMVIPQSAPVHTSNASRKVENKQDLKAGEQPAQLSAGRTPAVPASTAPAHNRVGRTIASAKLSAPSEVAVRPGPNPLPVWHLLELHDDHWSELPAPVLPERLSNSLIVGRVALMAINHQLILFQLTAGHELAGQFMDIQAAASTWHPLPPVILPHPTRVILSAAFSHEGVLAWTSAGAAGRTDINGLVVQVSDRDNIQLTRWQKPLVSTIVGSAFGDIAMGRDGDCFAILISQASHKLTQYTFSLSGQLLQGPENIIPIAKSTNVPGDYERLILAALIVLLALSVWRRKEPFGTLKVSPKFHVARLYRRFGAAGIDLALAALVVMLVFHLYTREDWVKMARASLDLLFNPQNLLKAPQFLWLLAIYEVHVTVSELIFARSLGKWILGLYVVDMTGQRPGFVALLTRNLFRIPEMIAIVVLVFMFVSTDRQRIGDILARTVVVQDITDQGKML